MNDQKNDDLAAGGAGASRPTPFNSAMPRLPLRRLAAAAEVALAMVAVALDLLLPTLVLLALAGLSLVIRREPLSTLGLVKPRACGWWPVHLLGRLRRGDRLSGFPADPGPGGLWRWRSGDVGRGIPGGRGLRLGAHRAGPDRCHHDFHRRALLRVAEVPIRQRVGGRSGARLHQHHRFGGLLLRGSDLRPLVTSAARRSKAQRRGGSASSLPTPSDSLSLSTLPLAETNARLIPARSSSRGDPGPHPPSGPPLRKRADSPFRRQPGRGSRTMRPKRP